MIVIIDYNVGNIGSILNMLKKIGVQGDITSDISKIESADKIILPGVGSFDTGMENLKNLGLLEVLNKKVLVQKTPVLGICLGMQLLTKGSEEGSLPGLGWIDGCVKRFALDAFPDLKVPHMGWDYVSVKKESLLFKDMYEEPKFYFVHSYYVSPTNASDVLTTTNYGLEFCSSLENGNIFGAQFHPEKSHKYGMKLLKNFADL
jgi:glutamine amidotransferase